MKREKVTNMLERKLIGIILVLISFFVAYQAYDNLISWQHRNKVVLGISDPIPYIEIIIAFFIAVIGIWLLVKQRTPEKED